MFILSNSSPIFFLKNLSEAIAKRKMSEDIFYNTSNDNSDPDGNCSLDTKLELLKTHIFKLLSDSKKRYFHVIRK